MTRKLLGMTTVALCALCTVSLVPERALAEDEAAEETAAPKKRPRKENEYRSWEKASAAAEAWEQPIIAFIELSGDKKASPMRNALLGRPEFVKEIVQPNALYFHVVVPKKKEDRKGGNNNKQKVKPLPQPDWDAMKGDDKAVIRRICDQKPPVLAIVQPGGKVLSAIPLESGGAFVKDFVDAAKSAFEMGKYTFTVTPKLQKLIDAEAKKVAEMEKRKR